MVSLNAVMISSPVSSAVLAAIWFGLAFLMSVLVLFVLLRSGLAMRLATDVPNHRSLHVKPIPRVGGWGIIPVSLLLMLIAAPQLSWLAAGAGLLAGMSHFDDRGGLSARVRFLVQFVVAATFFTLFRPVLPVLNHWWCLVVLTFGLVWLINLYNFMDGADGLAGGMAVVGFLAYALAAAGMGHQAGSDTGSHMDPQLAYAAIIVCGATAGFLLFNFHPARIFLGDAGSIPLGFLAGALGYWGWRAEVWPCWFPLLVFAPFIADASVTLLRRVLRGEKFWHAHREHYYQRMVQMGMGHQRTALSWYAVMVVGAALALSLAHVSLLLQIVGLGFWGLVLLLCARRIDQLWARFNQMKVSQ